MELSPEERKIKDRVSLVTRFCKKTYYGDDYDNLWFKRPFFFEKSEVTGIKLFIRFLQYLYPDIYDGSVNRPVLKKSQSYEDYEKHMLKERPFTLVLKHGRKIERFYHRVDVKFEKEVEINDDTNIAELLNKLEVDFSECEIDARFTKDGYKLFSFDRMKNFKDNLTKFSKAGQENVTVTLEQCFSVFEEKEKLEPGNEWYCSNCKDHKLATKEITIYKAPEILILHLKRFKSKGILRKEKNETNVKFPLSIDIKNYVIDPTPMSSYNPFLVEHDKYIKPGFEMTVENDHSTEYELYAVSNHFGGLGGGHYTAYAKNNGQWYEFNDSSVRGVSEGGIAGSGAYMLFYQRKQGLKLA